MFKKRGKTYQVSIDCAAQDKYGNPIGKREKWKTLSIRKREKERGIYRCPEFHSSKR